jgi:hypothetical protein
MPRGRAVILRPTICAFLAAAPLLAGGEQTPAERLIVDGHWKRARALVEPHYREAPNDPLASFLMSQIRNAFGDRESPPKLADRAVILAPNVAKFHRQVAEVAGVTAQRAGLFHELVLAHRFKKEIDTALSLDANDLQALRDLTEFYLLAPSVAGGDLEKARATASRLGALNPSEGLLAEARVAEVRKESHRVEGLLKRAVEAGPTNFHALEALAAYELSPDHQNLDLATQMGKAALDADPTRVSGYSILAQIYAQRAAWSDLDALLAASEKQVPDDLTPFYRAAVQLLTSRRDLPRAERYLQKYLAQEPEGNEPTRADAEVKLVAVKRANLTR